MNAKKQIHTGLAITMAVLAGGLLFVGQVIGQCGVFGLSSDTVQPEIIREGLEKAISSPWFMAEAGWYLILGTLIHALILLVPIVVVRDIAARHGFSTKRVVGWIIAATLLFLGLLFLWNSALFPFSDIIPNFQLASIWPLALLTVGFFGLFLAWLLSRPGLHTVLAAAAILFILYLPVFIPVFPTSATKPDQPNVILIGIDSLRPDHLTSAGGNDPSLMPHLQQWLSKSVVYDDAVTPMARTFPALTSLLTAKYPRNNGARINLTPDSRIDLGWTLGKYLKQYGYTTALAIDGARFANFSQNFGFDKLDTPQQGVSNFVFGDLIDSVGTNLLNLFPVARWLSPVNYGNRDATASYRPTQFDDVLARLVSRLPSTSSFVMVHFNLAHLPYVRKSIFSKPPNPALPFAGYEPYERGLAATDKQFAHYLKTLNRKDMLQNAIVVVYSDHGNEFGIKKDRAFRRDHQLSAGRLGHGTSIFSPAQSRILLAMQYFKDGEPQLQAGPSHKPALLTDIAPTLLHHIGRMPELPDNLDGLNLAGPVPDNRIRYIESSALMPTIIGGKVDRTQLLKQFGSRFRVTDNLRVRAKKSVTDGRLKQRGALIGNRVVGVAGTTIKSSDPAKYGTRWQTAIWPPIGRPRQPDISRLAQESQVADFFGLPQAVAERVDRSARSLVAANHAHHQLPYPLQRSIYTANLASKEHARRARDLR